jgi:hypothetical protein
MPEGQEDRSKRLAAAAAAAQAAATEFAAQVTEAAAKLQDLASVRVAAREAESTERAAAAASAQRPHWKER